ncbi:DNA polymerase III subunit beta [Natroniella acetigena]|uniref:DNA polymerase III subunit beta n=1 Tax=Natroniella acetigena TaxID=52004 RepID=UPI00200A7A52|nr:DNA polymerase III subunit beta [Natroniella acetigena]MCK8826835.1 DNA polymerase III subunit beta [Natroniella acetigena]
MRIKLQQKEFYQGIQTVRKAVSSKTTLPILSGILLKTEKGKLKLVGTDLEIGIECYVDTGIIQDGSIVLPAQHFANIIRELPNQEIILSAETSNNTAQIKCGNSQFNIHGSPADEFPLLPEIDSGTIFTVEQQKLKKIIEQIKFATSKDENKPFLSGGLLLLENKDIKLIATDTYRLAYKEDVTDNKKSDLTKAIIPNTTLQELTKLLDNKEERVEVILTDNQILFKFSGISVVSRLIEGQFPNYKQVIPDASETEVSVDTKELLQATKRAALLAKEDSDIIKINFNEDKLIITSNAPEIGQAYEEVPISLLGQETEIAFNAKYVLDALKVISDEEVNIKLSGPLAPGVIETSSEQKYIYVIMPVRSA